MPTCERYDPWDHMIWCKFYDTKQIKKWLQDEEKIADYMVLAKREHMKTISKPEIVFEMIMYLNLQVKCKVHHHK